MVELLVCLQLLCALHQAMITMRSGKRHPVHMVGSYTIHIADTAEELVKLVGVKNGTFVVSAISKASKHDE